MVLDRKLLARISLIQALVILVGLAGFGLWLGRIGLLSFGAGATIASIMLWVLTRIASAASGSSPGPLTVLLFTSRLLIAGLILYVILRTYEVHLPALACGVLTPVLAILLATLYDYASL
jgi:hypothetical protein